MRPPDGRPAILAACNDPGDTRRIERGLLARCEADHRVLFEGSAVGEGYVATQQVHECAGWNRPKTRA